MALDAGVGVGPGRRRRRGGLTRRTTPAADVSVGLSHKSFIYSLLQELADFPRCIPRSQCATIAARMIKAIVCVLILSVAMPVAAQQRKTVAGAVSIIAGVGLVIESYSSAVGCPEHYHPATPRDQVGWGEGGVHQCVRSDPGAGFDIIDATYDTGIKRSGLAWTGLGAIGLGVAVLLLRDRRATRDLDVQVSPERVTVRRKFGW